MSWALMTFLRYSRQRSGKERKVKYQENKLYNSLVQTEEKVDKFSNVFPFFQAFWSFSRRGMAITITQSWQKLLVQ